MTDQRFEVQHRAGESRYVLVDHEADPADPAKHVVKPTPEHLRAVTVQQR